jgi:hypothetical protein
MPTKMKDLNKVKSFLSLDWRFRDVLEKVKSLGPGTHRDTVIGNFWRFVYSGYYTSEVALLPARGK